MFILKSKHDAAMALHEKEMGALRDRLSGAIGRNLTAQATIAALRPAADKWLKAQQQRKAARAAKVAK